jgi:hypothetical protein
MWLEGEDAKLWDVVKIFGSKSSLAKYLSIWSSFVDENWLVERDTRWSFACLSEPLFPLQYWFFFSQNPSQGNHSCISLETIVHIEIYRVRPSSTRLPESIWTIIIYFSAVQIKKSMSWGEIHGLATPHFALIYPLRWFRDSFVRCS